MLSEIASHRGTNTVWSPLHEIPGVLKFVQTESRRVAAEGRGREK